MQYNGVAEARRHRGTLKRAVSRPLPRHTLWRRNPDPLGNVRTVTEDAMLGRDRKEHLTHPYPGLLRNPAMLDAEFDVDKGLPLVRYRILVDGHEDAAGEFHCDHFDALDTATSMIHAGRYAPLGKRLAEVEVYDAEGNLLGRDRQVRTRVNGQKTVQWESIAGRGARAEETEARVRAMGPPRSSR